jgi:predicted nucleic acid-binding protein
VPRVLGLGHQNGIFAHTIKPVYAKCGGRLRLCEYLERFVVLPYDRDLCTKWAGVTVAAQACGRRIDCADAWIAATTLVTGAPLITHNRNGYLGVPGLTLISHGQ